MVIAANAQFDDRAVSAAFAELLVVAGDARPALIAISKDWFKNNKKIFTLKGPGKYKDLSPAYKKAKERFMDGGSAYPILRAKFCRIETGLTVKGSDYNVFDMDKTSMTLGVKNIPYAIVHQQGSEKRNIPKRIFIFNSKSGGDDFKLQMKRWIGIFTTTTARRLAAISKRGGT